MSESRNDEQRDPATELERKGMNLLGGADVRDGAIEGVSGMPGNPELRSATPRRNPPQLDDVNNMAGDLSQSGGVAGGDRGGFGASDAGAGGPDETLGGPAQYKGTSRLDLDHPSSDIGGEDNDPRAGEMGPDRG